jgi:hypothetical protein
LVVLPVDPPDPVDPEVVEPVAADDVVAAGAAPVAEPRVVVEPPPAVPEWPGELDEPPGDEADPVPAADSRAAVRARSSALTVLMSAATLAWAADAWLRASAQVVGAPPPGLGTVEVVVDVLLVGGVDEVAHNVVA